VTALPLDAPRARPLLKRLLPRTLFARAIMIIVTPLVLLQAVATYIFYDRHWDTLSQRLAFAIAGEVALLVDQVQSNPSPAHFRHMAESANRHLDLIIGWDPGAVLTDRQDRLPESPVTAALVRALAQKVPAPAQLRPGLDEEWVEIVVQQPDGVLRVMTPVRRMFSPTTYIFILWMVGLSLVLFAVALLFMRNQIRPIRRLAVAADRFGRGIDVPSFKIEGATEVRLAAAAFIEMRERIRRQISQRTEMLAGVSHDLRTPLTRMKLQLELLDDSPDVADLKADVAEMERMVEGYLAFARGEGAEPAVRIPLDEAVAEVVASARRAGHAVDLHVEEALTLPLRPSAFKRCLANLVGNAGRYGGHVWIAVGRRGGAAEIVIDDDGPGIPADQREEVFKPFYRLEDSRNPETGGTGLGLTIARDIARGHGGDVVLADSPRGGLRAVIRLPL